MHDGEGIVPELSAPSTTTGFRLFMCLVHAPVGGRKRHLTIRLRSSCAADDVMSASSYGYAILVAIATGVISTCLANEDDYRTRCDEELGMRSKDIPDSALSASSSYDNVVGPLNARIRTERQGGAWCPKSVVSRASYEWLQIDFDELKVITAVETQGRYGNGQGQEFSPHYIIEYQRQDGDRWMRHRNRNGQELMTGNSNTHTAERRELEPIVVARRVRFVPYSHHPRTVCMRVELYGCTWKDGILSYDMPQGHKRGHDLDFSDSTYDGISLNDHLSGGLGKLTDKEEGHSNFRLDVSQSGKRGFEWIAWKKDSPLTDPVEIHFQFDTVRQFSEVRIHSNNLFSKDVKVFRAVEIQFSVGGRYYGQGQGPVLYEYPEDSAMEEARPVAVSLPGVVGRFVKLSLYFNSRWIMISEVEFDSEIANGTYAVEETPTEPTQASIVQSSMPVREEISDWPKRTPIDQSESSFSKGFLDPYDEEFDDDYEAKDNVGQDNEGQDDEGQDIEGQGDADWPQTTSSTLDRAPSKSYLGVLAGSTAAVVIVIAGVVCICLVLWYRRRTRRHGNYSSALHKSVFVVDQFHLDPSGSGKPPVAMPQPSRSGAVDVPARRTSRLDEQKFIHDLIGDQLMHDEVSFDPRDVTSTDGVGHARQQLPRPLPPPPPPHSHLMNPSSCVLEEREDQRMSADSVVSLEGIGRWTLVSFPRERLRVVEKLGEGSYKEIRVCELTSDVTSENRMSSEVTNRNDSSLLVILKSLKHDASIQDRKDFEEEIDRAFSFDHRNIVRFFGLCENGTSLEMVLEYSQYGTLHQFLQQRTTTINTADIGTKYEPPFSQGYLIHMATEIASGMKYLESRGLAHRDLATRNCLVSQQRAIKITDMASDCHRYTNHYYHVIGGRTPMPIRWMAWESVLLRNFSSRSDVWSFGVTMWEVLTCARTMPFDHLSNQQVIDNCCHYYQADGLHLRLSQPTGCAKEIYDLMVECWNKDAGQRPTFKEIHMFLSRKNLGFNPYEEASSECGIDNLAIGDVA